MFAVAIGIGVYGYIIFFLGILGLLHANILFLSAILLVCYFLTLLIANFAMIKKSLKKFVYLEFKLITIVSLGIVLLGLQILVNLIGALGPELGFDALWYHLTIPKLYLQDHTISFIPGNLLYYSAMPKLIEMLYIPALAIQGEILAKLAHFFLGMLSCIALYKVARSFLPSMFAVLVVLIFYTNLVVSWESITAYIDLGRTLFELLAFTAFINWIKTKSLRWLSIAAVMVGFAIATKLLAVGSFAIFSLLMLYSFFSQKDKKLKTLLMEYFLFSTLVAVVIGPWLLFSFIHTGSFVYPFFTELYGVPVEPILLSPLEFLRSTIYIFLRSADPISPIYILLLPVVVYIVQKLTYTEKVVALYCLVAFLVWYITPRTGGGRFLLPYLPIFSMFMGITLHQIKQNTMLQRYCIGIVLFLSVVTIFYRGFANAKYIPVILGQHAKDDFLSQHLNFSFGDFYDTDQYFSKTIEKSDKVLLYGFHNLYYVDFPFIHESWVKKGDRFNYIAVQNNILPERFSDWQMIYKNNKTHVVLYTNNQQMVAY